jgi:RNA polymerase sigma-70 factor (ECF subfamily)
LPAPFRVVFVLRMLEQHSVRETAASLGIPEETVKTRLHRANRRLRQRLGNEFAAIWDDAFPFAGRRCDAIVTRVLARLAGGAGLKAGAPGSEARLSSDLAPL